MCVLENIANVIINQQYAMKLSTLTTITRSVICAGALTLAGFAWFYNPAHLFTAAIILAFGLNVEWKKKED